VSSLGFGLLVYVKDDMNFFVLSLILKFMQGFGDAAVTTAFFSIISIEFSKDQELYFGYFESAVGVGLMIGPAMGQLLFNIFDFEWTFYITAIIVAYPVIL
jgi:MFS family permease